MAATSRPTVFVTGAAAGIAYAHGAWPATVGFVGVLLAIAAVAASAMFRRARRG